MKDLNASARPRGLTLVELLSTLAVALLLLAVGIPGWAQLTRGNAVNTERNHMMATLARARHSAVHLQHYVTICPSLDQKNCLADHTVWHEGYMVFVDKDGDRKLEDEDRLLQVSQPNKKGLAMHTSTGRKTIRFNPLGTSGSSLTMSFCAKDNAEQNKAVILHGAGRARLSDTRPDGTAVRCNS